MVKKSLVTILCVAVFGAGLLFGCGQTQSEEAGRAVYVFEEITADDIADLAEDLADEMEKFKDEIVIELAEKIKSEGAGQGKADASDLVGTWKTTLNYAAALEKEMEMDPDFAGFHGDFDLVVYLTFYDDDTFAMYIDEVEAEPVLKSFLESLVEYSVDTVYDMFAESGFSKEELNAMVEEEAGMGIYDYLMEEFSQTLTMEDLAGEIYQSGVYEIKGNRLYLGEHDISSNIYDIFTLEGDTLTLMPPKGTEPEVTGIEGIDYPYVFTKVE